MGSGGTLRIWIGVRVGLSCRQGQRKWDTLQLCSSGTTQGVRPAAARQRHQGSMRRFLYQVHVG